MIFGMALLDMYVEPLWNQIFLKEHAIHFYASAFSRDNSVIKHQYYGNNKKIEEIFH